VDLWGFVLWGMGGRGLHEEDGGHDEGCKGGCYGLGLGVSEGLFWRGRDGLAREFRLNFRAMIGLGLLLLGIELGCGMDWRWWIPGDWRSR
jgi:hypothetical protein